MSVRPLPPPVRAAAWSATCLALVTACGGGEAGGKSAPKAPAAKSEPATPARPANAPRPHPIFGEPLVINGEVIPFEAIKRHLSLGVYGQPLIESRKLEIYIENELRRRAEAGEDVSGFEVSPDEVEKQVSLFQEQLAQEYPQGGVTLDDALPTLQPSKNPQGFRDRIKVSQLFDQVFLPENPYELPPVSQAALDSTEGVKFVDQLKEAWDMKQAALTATPPPPAAGQPAEGGDVVAGQAPAEGGTGAEGTPQNPMSDEASNAFMKKLQNSLVLQYLEKNTKIEHPEDGIPEDLVLRVDGSGVRVDEIWQEIQGLVTPANVEASKKWLVNVTLAKQALEKAGAWLTDEEYAQVYAEVHDPYKDSPFSLERVAVNYRKFPSVTDYRTYFRIYSSFKKMVKDDLTEEALQGQLERLNLLLAGQIDCDIILISAYDFPQRRWKENGWAEAAQRTQQVAKELAEGKPWDEAVEQYSEFYDLPIPKSQEGQPPASNSFRHNKGRYVGVKRNDLVRRLEDSDYTTFLESSSIGDQIFFYMEPGDFANPLRGPYGFYIPLVKSRILTATPANLANDTHRSLAEQDYLAMRLNRFLWDLKQSADIYGI